jgi:hypothetical protein
VAAVQTLFDAWCDAEVAAVAVRATRARATAEVARIIGAINTLLSGTMDRLALVLGASNPAFAEGWTIRRAIVDPATRTRALSVQVVSVAGGQRLPVGGAQAVINPGGLRKKASPKGRFYVQNLKAGAHTLTVRAPGLPDTEVAFVVPEEKGVEVEVVMG